MADSVAASPSVQVSAGRGSPRAPIPYFHLGLAVLISAIVILGFWPFYATIFTGEASAHPLIWAHAGVFTGWLVLLMAQTWLVARRRVGVHRRLGRFGIYYGFAVLLLGVFTAFGVPVNQVATGGMTLDEAAGFLVLPLGDLVLFSLFFVPGVVHRKRPETHRRLMILAAVALSFPGAARFGLEAGPAAILAIWLLPLLLAMGHDVYTRGRPHRVYGLGLAVLLVGFGRVGLMEAEPWLVIGRRMLTPWL
ncbi:MAG: hypothetical protein WEA09_13310 [Gemmatimonadota bacterium]